MYELDATAYFRAVTSLERAISFVKAVPGTEQTKVMSEKAVGLGIDNLRAVETAISPLPVPVTKLTLTEAIDEMADDAARLKYIEAGQLMLNVSNTLRRELTTAKVFVLDGAKTPFYEPQECLFGEVVQSKFPSLLSEIELGGKCFACDLPTAAAFHWLRTLEGGVRAITRCLGLPDPTSGHERNWSNVTRSIREEIERRWPAKTGRMAGDAKFFDKALASLVLIQNPYRNETMHLDANYTSSEVRHLFEMVKGLMVQIASRMDEQGLPLA